MAGFEKLGREYLRDLLGEEPVYPVTHPRGPRGIAQLDHAPWLERQVFEEEQPPGRCILRRSCGRSCYCARRGAQAVVEEMRRRHGPWWPAEPPMLVGSIRYSREVAEGQRQRKAYDRGVHRAEHVNEVRGAVAPEHAVEAALWNYVPAQYLTERVRPWMA